MIFDEYAISKLLSHLELVTCTRCCALFTRQPAVLRFTRVRSGSEGRVYRPLTPRPVCVRQQWRENEAARLLLTHRNP